MPEAAATSPTEETPRSERNFWVMVGVPVALAVMLVGIVGLAIFFMSQSEEPAEPSKERVIPAGRTQPKAKEASTTRIGNKAPEVTGRRLNAHDKSVNDKVVLGGNQPRPSQPEKGHKWWIGSGIVTVRTMFRPTDTTTVRTTTHALPTTPKVGIGGATKGAGVLKTTAHARVTTPKVRIGGATKGRGVLRTTAHAPVTTPKVRIGGAKKGGGVLRTTGKAIQNATVDDEDDDVEEEVEEETEAPPKTKKPKARKPKIKKRPRARKPTTTKKPTPTTKKPTATSTEKPTATSAEKPTATSTEKPTATSTEKPTTLSTEKSTTTTEKPTTTTENPTTTTTKKPTTTTEKPTTTTEKPTTTTEMPTTTTEKPTTTTEKPTTTTEKPTTATETLRITTKPTIITRVQEPLSESQSSIVASVKLGMHSDTRLVFEAAADYCQNTYDGGSLLVTHDLEEELFLTEQLKEEKEEVAKCDTIFVGFRGNDSKRFFSMDGTKFVDGFEKAHARSLRAKHPMPDEAGNCIVVKPLEYGAQNMSCRDKAPCVVCESKTRCQGRYMTPWGVCYLPRTSTRHEFMSFHEAEQVCESTSVRGRIGIFVDQQIPLPVILDLRVSAFDRSTFGCQTGEFMARSALLNRELEMVDGQPMEYESPYFSNFPGSQHNCVGVIPGQEFGWKRVPCNAKSCFLCRVPGPNSGSK